MSVSYVLLAYGNWSYTERCLRSLEACGLPGPGDELIVVDNGSLDETPEQLRAWEHVARVVTLAPNRNFAGGINAGIRAAQNDVLVLLNNDLEVSPGALEALVEEAAKPDVGIVGTRLLYPDGRIQHGGFGWRDEDVLSTFHLFHGARGDLPAACTVVELDVVTGACIAARGTVLEELHGFDEGFVNGWEDVDLCLRAGAAGYRVVYRGDVHLVHHESVTAGTSWNSDANLELFRSRWSERQFGDAAHVRDLYGGSVALPTHTPPVETAGGAFIELRADLSAFGPDADESRFLLELLEALGLQPAARDRVSVCPAPELGDEGRARLLEAGARRVRHNALRVSVGTRADAPIVRLAHESDAPGTTIWSAVGTEPLRSPVPRYPVGPGGAGVLAVLPAHDHALCAQIVESVQGLDVPVTFLPTVSDLRLPRPALRPAATEAELAALAAAADVVVCLDPDDAFQRRALVAARAGAAVVASRGGQAEEVLGDLLHDSIAAALADTTPRAERAQRVADECDAQVVGPRLTRLLAAALAG
ncbi:MAG: glycosyltransferase family 2 protein [Gaiellaceae bacterium]